MDQRVFEVSNQFSMAVHLDVTKKNLESQLHEVRRAIDVDGFTWWFGTQDNFFEITTRPKEWMDYYEENNCLLVDPIVKAAFTVGEPFVWSEQLERMKLSKQEKEFMALAAEKGLVDGVHLPVGAVIGNFGVLNVYADSSERILKVWDTFQLPLMSISHTCYSVSSKLHARVNKHVTDLSPQEAKALTMFAAGYSRKKVAETLDVSIYTVDGYCNSIMEKLGTPNIAGAIGVMRSSDLIPYKRV